MTTHAGTAKHNKNGQSGGGSPAGPISVQIISNDEDAEKYEFGNMGMLNQQFEPMGTTNPPPRTGTGPGPGRSPYTKKYRTVWETIPELKSKI